MASLPQSTEASYLISSGSPSFESSFVHNEHHSQQIPLSSPSFPALTEFEGHFQEIHGQESWRAPAVHHEQPSTMYSSSPFERLTVENCGAPMFSRYGDSHHSLAEMARGSWNGKLSHLLACANRMDDNPMSQLAHGYLSEDTSIPGMIPSVSSNGALKVPTSPLNGFSHPLPLIGKHFDYSFTLDSPNVGLTIDPSKGGLAIQNVSCLPAQSSLCTQPVDPMFTDKTANFTFFNKQPSSLPLSAAELTHDPAVASPLMRDGGISKTTLASHSMLHRAPSGIGTPSSSTSNSPSGREILQQSALRNRQETLNSVATDPQARAYSSMVTHEEPKYPSGKKPSLLPTLVGVDGSEGMAKQCASIDDSDESMGDITSSCERDNGWETSTYNTSRKKKRTKDRSKNDAGRLLDAKDAGGEEGQDKRQKGGDHVIEDDLDRKQEQSNDSDESMHKESSKLLEAAAKPDYIHVRARRGQATDSHSLAERIRREKISERMKFLQDLVPGCSKITGKAVMLDEIINYVQSLQRQVEFLSMKLAAVNPRVEFNMDHLFRRDIFQPRASPHQPLIFSAENPLSYKPMQQAPLPMGAQGVVSHPPIDIHSLCKKSDPPSRIPVRTQMASKENYGDVIPQASQAWDDELQNVVHMSLLQGRQTPLTPPIIQGHQQPFPGQMKPEF